MVELGKIYEEGELIPRSNLKAMQWYHSASDKGNESAKTRFEDLIRFDPQDPEDLDEYEQATRMIGEDNDDDYTICLADCLAEGDGVPVDLPKAKMWYEIASQLGVYGAEDGLKKIDSLMKKDEQPDGQTVTE